jgi:uncharacterized membrane protein YjjB (DUF3815 family)
MLTYLFAFITSAASVISFRGPLRAVPAAGLAGVLGWAGYDGLTFLGAPEMLRAFVGALLVGAAGEWMARRLKEPTTMFIVPGLFPLVPGLMAYNGMLYLAREEMVSAAQTLTRTAFYAGALAAGLALPPAIFRRRR